MPGETGFYERFFIRNSQFSRHNFPSGASGGMADTPDLGLVQ
jgi:hypothetical protein